MEAPFQYGDDLLAALAALPPTCPAVMLVRHAARYPIEDLRTADDVQLTPAGEEAARAFGARLPIARPARIFHSHINRCRVTAARIAEGFADAGGAMRFEGVLPGLCGAFVNDFERLVHLTREHQQGFVRAWFDGRLDPAVIDPCAVAAERLCGLMHARIAAAAPGELVIMVSHDWEIMTLRETFLGARHEAVGWADFLDGLVLARDGDVLRFRWREFAAERAVEDNLRG